MTVKALLMINGFENLTSLTLQRLNESLFSDPEHTYGLKLLSLDLARPLTELHISGELKRDYMTRVKGNQTA